MLADAHISSLGYLWFYQTGHRQNVDPPIWTPLLDPFWTPFWTPFWIPLFLKLKINKYIYIYILKNTSKQIIKSPTITLSCTFYREAQKVTG